MATSELISEQKSFVWRIPNFAEVLKSEELLKDQNFEFVMCVGDKEEEIVPLEWLCYLCLNDEEEDKDYLGMYLRAENVPPKLSNAHVRVHFQIPGKGNTSTYFDQDTTFSIKDSFDTKSGYGFSKLIFRRPNDTTLLSADGSLEIRVTVTVFHHSTVQDAELAALEAEFKDKFAANHRAQISALPKDPLNTSAMTSTSCAMVSKDIKYAPADRAILHARSPVFKAMFQSGMSEAQDGVLEVKDIDCEPLKVLLRFIHRGELASNWKEEGVMEGLVYGAHKYMLEDLMEFLDKGLGLVCTEGNCGKLAGLAKAFGMKKAEELLLEYFKKNLANSLEQVAKFVQDCRDCDANDTQRRGRETAKWEEARAEEK